MYADGQAWPWEDASLDKMEMAYRRMRAMFEFLDKIGADYWCFHDRCSLPKPSKRDLLWNSDGLILLDLTENED